MALDFLTGCFGWRPTELSAFDGTGTQFLMRLLNVILVIPAALAAFGTRKHYLLIERHPELSQYPYDQHAGLAFFMTYITCVVIFPWVFVSFALLHKYYKEWTLGYGIINLGLAVSLTMGLTLQARFLPASTDGCTGSKPFEWQVLEGNQSFFERAARLDKGTKDKTESVCKDMVNDWLTACAVVFFQSVLAYLSVFFDGRERSLLNPMRPFFLLVMLILTPIVLVCNIFTKIIIPHLRLYTSFVRKITTQLLRRRWGKKEPDIQLQPRFRPQWTGYHMPKTKLMNVLNIEHVLLNIVEYLHHEDVVALGATCRAVREAVYPSADMHFRLKKLKQYACSTGPAPTSCIYCNAPLCTTCRVPIFHPTLPARRHIYCIPYCQACYYTSFASYRPTPTPNLATQPRRGPRRCKCGVAEEKQSFYDCCRKCVKGDVGQLQKERRRSMYAERVDKRYNQRLVLAHGGPGRGGIHSTSCDKLAPLSADVSTKAESSSK
ncbi:hypothetical protein BU23DRAFT_636112 [Bimuria novae-zelandiae CBS 107.79]|uniref:F-box domain-containing protein n=1 Tax=Bimuria novae-zelandiae CBS 107.79 TaxID=1447943 RepID=A0A6A5VCU0_9PLEO|nr:hypothetical protein BU23DRAFT_636112 [Bimuria novae-zelandiae CBS 107.79]